MIAVSGLVAVDDMERLTIASLSCVDCSIERKKGRKEQKSKDERARHEAIN